MKDRQLWLEKMNWKDSLWEEECPFCEKNNDEEYLVLKRFQFWYIKKNLYPYNWIKEHLLLIPYRHIEHTKNLNKQELNELVEVYEFIEKLFLIYKRNKLRKKYKTHTLSLFALNFIFKFNWKGNGRTT